MKHLLLQRIWEVTGVFFLAFLVFGCEKEPVEPDTPEPATVEIDIPGADSNILIMKVDYQTFQYEGYTTVNVDSTNDSSDTIPFLATYCAPGDFGYVKLFYENPSHLLFYGDMIWMGCGNLHFPTSFMELPAQSAGLSYPGNNRICFIDFSGAQQPLPWEYDLVDETMIENVWETISKQPEFQYYYSETNKKVAVFLYMPSVGVGNPADWDFIIFVEKNECCRLSR